jgi:hypothetical protein
MKTATAQGSESWYAIARRAANTQVHRPNYMEHRWGPRRPCRARVCLSSGGGIVGPGRLRDVSMSGAFIETAVRLPLFAQLSIAVLRDDGATHQLEFPAVVVRHEENGVGIEWCDPNPGSICRALNCGIDCGYAKGQPA